MKHFNQGNCTTSTSLILKMSKFTFQKNRTFLRFLRDVHSIADESNFLSIKSIRLWIDAFIVDKKKISL